MRRLIALRFRGAVCSAAGVSAELPPLELLSFSGMFVWCIAQRILLQPH
jgi:hypothetical protein